MGCYGLINMYLVLMKHVRVIRCHQELIHHHNPKVTKISQNGHKSQINHHQVFCVYAIECTPLGTQMHRKGSKWAS